MRSWHRESVVAFAVGLAVAFPCFGQNSPGPATLESLVNAGESQQVPAVAASEEGDAGPRRPAGTVARPKDGVQHPDLDKAWAEYDMAVAKAAEGIKAAISKQFAAATAKGNLDAAEKWQAALEMFEKTGEVPVEAVTKAAVSAAVAEYKNAEEELSKTYEAVVKSLTMAQKIAEAKAVRNELLSIQKMATIGDEDAKQTGSKTRKKEAVFLSDLQERDVVVGWGRYGKNGDLFGDGKVIVLGQEPKKGVSMHPQGDGIAKASFDVPVGLTTFEAVAAINDSASNRQPTPLVFKVFGDGKLLWQSPPLRGGGAAANCKVRLKASRTLTLLVECPGNSQRAHAVWCDPRFTSE
jgi:hypothetical protein